MWVNRNNQKNMKVLGNIIWFIFGGIEIAIEYFLAGTVLLITIIGIPFGLQCFKLGVLALWPFGSEVKKQSGKTGCLSTGMNILWFFLGGILICLTHVAFGVLFYLTIIGIPFGNQHFKLAHIALTPFGREIVN